LASASNAAAAETPAAAPAETAQAPAGGNLTRADLNGYWVVTNFVPHMESVDKRITYTVEGDPVPLRPDPKAVYDKRIADARRGIGFGDLDSMCMGPGVPRMMRGPGYPFYIFQPSGMLVINFEILHNIRWIYLNAEHPKAEDIDHNFQGDSIGHWEGTTLVVDTIGLSAKTNLDKLGLPNSDDLHVIEHIYLTSKNTFEDLITIDDPKTFTKVWSVKATYKRLPPDPLPSR